MKKHIDTQYDVVVIGAGASGMLAAGRAAELGAKVVLLEKNKQVGKKLGISGGGRCNITNAEEDVHAFTAHYGDGGPFLFSPLSQFGVLDTFSFFERLGLPLVTQARKRAFPHTEDAHDVVDVLDRYARDNGCIVRTNVKVLGIDSENGLYSIETKEHIYKVPYCVIATGGVAAPETGSTGDGFTFARRLGHTIKEPNPNIVPLTTDARWVHTLAGTSLSFMRLRFIQDGVIKITKVGKILFTHFGISGPLVLNTAHDVVGLLEHGEVTASVDMFPDTEIGDLNQRLIKLFDRHKNKLLKNVLPELISERVSTTILQSISDELLHTPVHSITKEERNELAHLLKDLQFPITGTLGYEDAVIADGGIPPEEINFASMESKIAPGLFVTGDMINITRPSGGYSLQLCWTTGYVAGSAIAGKLQRQNTSE